MSNPKIKAEVERIQAKAVVAALGSKAELLNLIWKSLEEAAAEGARRDLYAGSELWLKATGQLVEKREIDQTSTVVEIEWQPPGGPQ